MFASTYLNRNYGTYAFFLGLMSAIYIMHRLTVHICTVHIIMLLFVICLCN